MLKRFQDYKLDYDSPVDPTLQSQLEAIHSSICLENKIDPAKANIGILDLKNPRLAMVGPDTLLYGCSVPKMAILLGYFQHCWDGKPLDVFTAFELGLMIKISSNEMAAKYSNMVGLKKIEETLRAYKLYDEKHGGGIWTGKHYYLDSERYPDPVGGHSHCATVRQVLHYYLMLEQEKLVSEAASKIMRGIFESPRIPHDPMKFLKVLDAPDIEVIRKSGELEEWNHDTAVVTGPGRHYILAALTNLSDQRYLIAAAAKVDELMSSFPRS